MTRSYCLLALALLIGLSTPVDSPVVGILFLPLYSRTRLRGSYMMATYPKWIEQLRLRWIPLYIDDPEDVWRTKIARVNGILLTGGGTPIIDDDTGEALLTSPVTDPLTGEWTPYGKWVVKTVQEAMRLNDEGHHKPIWGTCLGFESMLLALTDRTIKFENELENLNVVLPVDFFPTSDRYLDTVFNAQDYEKIRTQKTFFHNHHCGFMWENCIKNEYIQQNIDMHATTTTITGHKVLASFTHKKYPFFAVQFHPEYGQFGNKEPWISDQDGFELETTRKMAKLFRNMIGSGPSRMTEGEIYEYKEKVVHLWSFGGNEIYQNRNKEVDLGTEDDVPMAMVV